MEKGFLLRRASLLFLILFFCFPVVYITFYIGKLEWAIDEYFLFALRGSFVQAFLSSVATLSLAFVGALGLMSLRSSLELSKYRWVEILFLLPGFIPPLVFVLLNLKWFPSFPFGLWGVVLLHTLMNVGIVAVIFERLIRRKALPWSELCLVEGVGKLKFLTMGLLTNLKSEIMNLFLFVFITCFMSFSIPFLVGGVEYGGVEVFIYEKIFLFREWGQALSMSISLTLFFMIASFFIFLRRENEWEVNRSIHATGLLKLPLGFLILALPLPGLFFGLFPSWGDAFYQESIWSLVRGTAVLSVGCGLLTFVVTSIVGFSFLRGYQSRLLFSFVPPGWMFIAFSLFLLEPTTESYSYAKVIWGLTILFTPYLYRLIMFSDLMAVENQVDIARTMGVSWFKIYFQLIWPQLLPTICLVSGIAAFWAAGDFAISSVLFQQDVSLALRMKSLMLNYRTDQALVLVPVLLLVSIVIFSVFQGMGYVCRRKIV